MTRKPQLNTPEKTHQTVSLILGSGGARGLAHIGVIRYLEQNGYKIESISGCSIGALVGGIYAAGKLDELEEWVTAINKVDIVRLLDLSWSKNGLFKGDRIINTLKELVGDIACEDLPIAFTAVAADIVNEEEVWLNSGSLFDAIRASISLPLLFTPAIVNGVSLIDGGVLNPVPIAPTFHDKTDFRLAVNLVGKAVRAAPVAEGGIEPGENKSKLANNISEFLDSIWPFDDDEENTGNSHKNNDVYDIANQAIDAMQCTIARQKLAAYPADRYLEIPRNACGILEFHRAAEMIELGHSKAAEHFGIVAYT